MCKHGGQNHPQPLMLSRKCIPVVKTGSIDLVTANPPVITTKFEPQQTLRKTFVITEVLWV